MKAYSTLKKKAPVTEMSNTRTKSSCCCCCLMRYCVFKYLFRSVAPVTRKPHALHARRHWEFFLFQKISTRRQPLDSALHSWSVSRTQRHACVSCRQRFLSRRPCCFRSPSVHHKSTSSTSGCSLRSDWLHAERAHTFHASFSGA